MAKPSPSGIDHSLVADMARDCAEVLALNPRYDSLSNHERFRHTVETCALLISAQFGSHHSNVDSTLQAVDGIFGKSIMAGLILTYYKHFVETDVSALLRGDKK